MTRKPIFIITFPSHDKQEHDITLSSLREICKKIENDYHVILVNDNSIEGLNYKMFSDQEIEPIELEKLKEIIGL